MGQIGHPGGFEIHDERLDGLVDKISLDFGITIEKPRLYRNCLPGFLNQEIDERTKSVSGARFEFPRELLEQQDLALEGYFASMIALLARRIDGDPAQLRADRFSQAIYRTALLPTISPRGFIDSPVLNWLYRVNETFRWWQIDRFARSKGYAEAIDAWRELFGYLIGKKAYEAFPRLANQQF